LFLRFFSFATLAFEGTVLALAHNLDQLGLRLECDWVFP
jgi:hypothetical protein